MPRGNLSDLSRRKGRAGGSRKGAAPAPADAALSLGVLLAGIPYFAGLDSRILGEIGRVVRRRALRSGETALIEGGLCEGLYFVIEGQIRLVKRSAEGREHVVGVLGRGATFNDVAVFDGGPNSDGAVAVGPTTIGFIPKESIAALIDHHPGAAKAALKLLSARQRTLGTVVEDLALRDVTTRVARLLLGCMGRHGHIVEQAPDACERITHQEIAAMVGSVREVVQRALKELERDGAITLERARLRVRDQSKLERWAHLDA